MHFGTIGAGAIGQAIAGHLVAAGHRVVLSNGRGPASLRGVVARLGPSATAGTVAEAAAADVVFLAVRWSDIPAALAELPAWNGRILVDTTNQMTGVTPADLVDLGADTGSEFVARHAPGARVVKAFNTLFAEHIAPDPRHPEGRRLLFYAGDDAAAKADFHAVADEIGFAPVDIGALRDGGRLMQVGGPLSALHALKQG
ncbi:MULTISPECIES: NADPH-dependent F420 reductase [unclassified Saccharopolyspora]|uniref:NADPH-dependent F420 reductase n=1 Tax=unclassified Saccharopolyspora TaxID=2646250 RepID=UPI001CD77C1E|nr:MULTISPECIES: NAD(P)-binding domain-containing protein [unclassified Saccharopolyspora]MCA1189250.1 NAD(P)-binding domain-containing protein [Saccharopolyspora sp. 6T]MCA1193396.1 NAD(P)-binding domain-containing protein [Saccharopolyspora sp. 6V]MCA1226912.1 NAD(P)-binding domain-containing protein [Saccharopolyspora sp. 6M]MCA1280629.1 NAD(P)-binding domain-containing protein [Saccharopolyspora sp. 7B]